MSTAGAAAGKARTGGRSVGEADRQSTGRAAVEGGGAAETSGDLQGEGADSRTGIARSLV